MSQTELANLLLLLALPAWNIYLLLYAFGTKWWTRRTGRVLFIIMLVYVASLDQNAASVWLGLGYDGRGVIRLLVYAGALLSGVLWLWNYLRVRRRGPAILLAELEAHLANDARS